MHLHLIRYQVLKRAKYCCELCGISAQDKALEVDLIIPRSLGGKDDLENFQAARPVELFNLEGWEQNIKKILMEVITWEL